MPAHNIAKDHLGNEFPSVSRMCEHYCMPVSTYINRISRGWTLEQALTERHDTTARKHGYKKLWTDHKGNTYKSVGEMCAAYNITEKIFWSRKRICKWPLEKILTEPLQTIPGNAKEITDHLGNVFPSVSAMCRHHNVKLTRYKERRKLGWDIERALTEPAKDMPRISACECEDHLGNKYKSKNDMCRAYGVTRYSLNARLALGWSLEKALTEPLIINARPVEDYMRRKFATIKDMANFYGIPEYRFGDAGSIIDKKLLAGLAAYYYKNRLVAGWAIIRCVKFPYFLVEINGQEHIAHFEKILDRYHNSDEFEPIRKTKTGFISIKRLIRFPYYLAEINGKESVISYWKAIALNAEHNFGLSLKEENK